MKTTCSKSTDPDSKPAPSSSDYSAVKCLKYLKASAKSMSTDRASTSDPISTDNTTTSDPSSLDNHSTPPPTAKSLASTPKDSQAATPQATPQATPWRFTGPMLIPVSPEVPKMMDTDAGRSIDEAGDRHIPQYVPSETVPKASYPTYSPTPRTQPMQQVSSGALEMKAEALMKTGCMPLLAPARRSWEQEEAIVLPASSPVPEWSPKGWASYSADSKLLVWETVATALAIKDGLQLDRGEILDTFNFLALPGSKDPVLKTKLQNCRYHNYKALRDVLLSRSSSTDLVDMFEAAKACHKPSISAAVLLEQIDRENIRIRI